MAQRRQQTADHRHLLTVRDNTFDAAIVHMVYDNDEYQLPHAPSERSAALDIGAHIGAFSLLAATRGYTVHAYEAHLFNYQLLVANTAHVPTILPFFAAVVGHHPYHPVPVYELPTTFVRERQQENTGGMAAHPATPQTDAPLFSRATHVVYTPAVAFDAIFANLVTVEQPDFIVVKLDCEGAEDAIFRSSLTITLADLILAEYHLGADAAASYAERLRDVDYDVTITPVTASLGYLRAVARSRRAHHVAHHTAS